MHSGFLPATFVPLSEDPVLYLPAFWLEVLATLVWGDTVLDLVVVVDLKFLFQIV